MTGPTAKNPLLAFGVERVGRAMRVHGSPLFLDAPSATEVCFVSHAHSDHIARHRKTIATAATLKLLTHRIGAPSGALAAPFGKPFLLGNFQLELLPAGHVLGSAQLRVTREDGRRIVYTGDLNPIPSLAAEAPEVACCDVLVIESTFGHPRFRFPPREEVYGRVRDFAAATLAEGGVPVFLAYTLGKSQEGMRALVDAGFRVAAHPAIADICDLFAELGHPIQHRRFDGTVEEGEVLFLPTNSKEALTEIPGARTAALSGWAVERGARYRLGTDEALPLSDHADFDGLVSYAEATGAKRVLTVHGYAKELAACLRDRGFDARPLDPPKQGELF